MIRIVIFLTALALVTFGFAWIADRPGEVAVTWMGYRIETSIAVAGLAVALIVLFAVFTLAVARAIMNSPEQVSLFFRHRRAAKGFLAISRGLIAIGAGDVALARRSAAEAARLAPGEPLALLLDAQSAQLSGDREGAEQSFRAMLDKPETRPLGLRGLYIEAQRRNDFAAARAFAEQAAAAAPALSWAGQAVLDYRCGEGDWVGALAALETSKGALDRADYRRRRAVLLTTRALVLQDSDRDTSLALALDAVKLAPDLVPAAAFAGRRLAEAGNPRKARKVLEHAWLANPHPDIANVYADVRPGDSARERFARIKKLAEKTPGNPEGALALAQAALDAREFNAARDALAPYLLSPTRRAAALMADIEQSEHGNVGRAREWMARAVRAAPDPVWTADGVVSDQWRPVSPVTGMLDAFRWKVPLAEIGVERPVIDAAEINAIPQPEAKAEVNVETKIDTKTDTKTETKTETKIDPRSAIAAGLALTPAKPTVRDRGAASATSSATGGKSVEAVIPLVHAPDDPGPDSPLEPDPVPEVPPLRRAPWQKIRQLFG
jgi:HemY protein